MKPHGVIPFIMKMKKLLKNSSLKAIYLKSIEEHSLRQNTL